MPARLYEASPRPYPRRLPPLDYAGHWEVRRVFENGCLWWRQRSLFLSEALVGQDVGFEEVGDGVWTIYFATVALARFDERCHRIQRLGSA